MNYNYFIEVYSVLKEINNPKFFIIEWSEDMSDLIVSILLNPISNFHLNFEGLSYE